MERHELQKRIEQTQQRLDHLKRGKARTDASLPCPDSSDHECRVLQVASGAMPKREILDRHGMGGWGGYQVRRCIICGLSFLYTYVGVFVAEITEDEARSLL